MKEGGNSLGLVWLCRAGPDVKMAGPRHCKSLCSEWARTDLSTVRVLQDHSGFWVEERDSGDPGWKAGACAEGLLPEPQAGGFAGGSEGCLAGRVGGTSDVEGSDR